MAPSSVRPHLTENILKQSREAESALADALVSFFFDQRNRPFPSKKQFYECLFISFLIFSFLFNFKAYFNYNCMGFSLYFLVFFCLVHSCSFLFILVLCFSFIGKGLEINQLWVKLDFFLCFLNFKAYFNGMFDLQNFLSVFSVLFILIFSETFCRCYCTPLTVLHYFIIED